MCTVPNPCFGVVRTLLTVVMAAICGPAYGLLVEQIYYVIMTFIQLLVIVGYCGSNVPLSRVRWGRNLLKIMLRSVSIS